MADLSQAGNATAALLIMFTNDSIYLEKIVELC